MISFKHVGVISISKLIYPVYGMQIIPGQESSAYPLHQTSHVCKKIYTGNHKIEKSTNRANKPLTWIAVT